MCDNGCWLDYCGDQPEIYSNFRLCYICQLYLNETEKGKNAPVHVLPFLPWATSPPCCHHLLPADHRAHIFEFSNMRESLYIVTMQKERMSLLVKE